MNRFLRWLMGEETPVPAAPDINAVARLAVEIDVLRQRIETLEKIGRLEARVKQDQISRPRKWTDFVAKVEQGETDAVR